MRLIITTLLSASLALPGFAQEAPITQSTPLPAEATTEQYTPPAPPSQREDMIKGLEDRRWYPATGRDLLNLIENCEEASCMSFVSGALTGLSTREFIMGRDNPFCAGDQVLTQDIRDALVTVIGSDPELQTLPVAFGIMATFSVTWPCQTNDIAATQTEDDPDTFSLEDMTQLDAGSILTVFENYPGALTLGNLAAPTVKTMVVFHDPNCDFCKEFKRETYALANTGWKIIVLPVGILGENSVAYSAMMYALSETRPDIVEALYQRVEPGSANVESALDIAATFDISAAEMLSMVSRTNAYESVEANNTLLGLLEAQGTPSWLISDYMFTGVIDAQSIIKVAREIPVPPGQIGFDRPGLDSTPEVDPIILPENTGE